MKMLPTVIFSGKVQQWQCPKCVQHIRVNEKTGDTRPARSEERGSRWPGETNLKVMDVVQ